MKSRLYRFVTYFSTFFIAGVCVNALFKEDLNLLTAFSVALGVSFGLVYFSPYLFKKFSRE